MAREFGYGEARAFYDWFGARQDLQRFYEDAAIGELLAHAAFAEAHAIVEFGCGTGRLAERLLADLLPPHASYTGFDVSRSMAGLSRGRLARFGSRARVILTDGSPALPLPDACCDRCLSTYVFDLLSPADARRVASEARRLLVDGGRLCLASLAPGTSPISRAVQQLWEFAYRVDRRLVGACRPVRLAELLGPGWRILHRRVVCRFGLCSDVLIAARNGASGGASG